jgi:hypothetical protein
VLVGRFAYSPREREVKYRWVMVDERFPSAFITGEGSTGQTQRNKAMANCQLSTVKADPGLLSRCQPYLCRPLERLHYRHNVLLDESLSDT